MQIRIRENARSYYVGMCLCQHQCINWEWADKLDSIAGQTIEVETDYLFSDQFNTGPIPGVSDTGMRIMQAYVSEVIDDRRIGAYRCHYCGNWHCSVTMEAFKGMCPTCGTSDHIKPFDIR